MSLLNKIEISGNLTKDPEMGETKGGTKTAKFDVAHNYKVKDETRNSALAAMGDGRI